MRVMETWQRQQERIILGKHGLGKIKSISRQGLEKDIIYFQKIRPIIEEKIKEEKEGEEK